jgi:hypothetical protein
MENNIPIITAVQKVPSMDQYFYLQFSYLERENPELLADLKSKILMFTQIHVGKALKTGSEKAIIKKCWSNSEGHDWWVDSDSIINSYPLENIK